MTIEEKLREIHGPSKLDGMDCEYGCTEMRKLREAAALAYEDAADRAKRSDGGIVADFIANQLREQAEKLRGGGR